MDKLHPTLPPLLQKHDGGCKDHSKDGKDGKDGKDDLAPWPLDPIQA
jgi:hypothetical protein